MHDHPHAHKHDHHHEHPQGEDAVKQTLALLRYMLEHNRHHADELHDLAHQLSDQGKKGAADSIHEAIHRFDEGNDLLEKALSAIEQEAE